MTLTAEPDPVVDGDASAQPKPVVRSRAVTWSEVDTGFYVASRAGEFVGSIDSTADGHFIAFDGTSSPIGRYATRDEARAAVVRWAPEVQRARERKLADRLMPFATGAGLVAAVVAASGTLLTI